MDAVRDFARLTQGAVLGIWVLCFNAGPSGQKSFDFQG